MPGIGKFPVTIEEWRTFERPANYPGYEKMSGKERSKIVRAFNDLAKMSTSQLNDRAAKEAAAFLNSPAGKSAGFAERARAGLTAGGIPELAGQSLVSGPIGALAGPVGMVDTAAAPMTGKAAKALEQTKKIWAKIPGGWAKNLAAFFLGYKAIDEVVSQPREQARRKDLLETQARLAQETAEAQAETQLELGDAATANDPIKQQRVDLMRRANSEAQITNARLAQNQEMLGRISEAHGPMLQSWQAAMGANGDPLITAAANYAASLGSSRTAASQAFSNTTNI